MIPRFESGKNDVAACPRQIQIATSSSKANLLIALLLHLHPLPLQTSLEGTILSSAPTYLTAPGAFIPHIGHPILPVNQYTKCLPPPNTNPRTQPGQGQVNDWLTIAGAVALLIVEHTSN